MASNDVNRLRESQLFPERPDSEINNQRMWDRIEFLENYIRAQKIVEGAADSDPPNTAPSTLTDAAPTTGAFTDIVVGQTLEISTSDRALNKRFVITDVLTGPDRIEVAENLFAAGVRSGDIYRVMYSLPSLENAGHIHDGIDSTLVPIANLAIIYGIA